MPDNIFADVEQEGTPIEDLGAEDEQEEKPEESQTETDQEEGTPSQEGDEESKDDDSDNTPDEEKDLPFHKHPRWQKQQDELAEARETITELQGMQETVNKLQENQQPQDVQLPQWWQTLAGTDEVSQKAYKQYQTDSDLNRKQIREELVKEQEESVKQQADEQKQWDSWVDGEVQNLKDEGLTFNRNELMKVAVEMQPTGEDGNISLKKAYDILQLQKAQGGNEANTERKKIADKTNSNNQGATPVSTTMGTNDLRNKSWSSLVKGT